MASLRSRRSMLKYLLMVVLAIAALLFMSSRRRLPLPSSVRHIVGGQAVVCSLLKRLIPRSGVKSLIVDLMRTSPPGALMVDVGLAHGGECFDVAEEGRRCMGFEADPMHAERIRQKAANHPNTSLLSITAAAAGDMAGYVTFSADRHNKHGVGGTLSTRLDEATGKPMSG